jgi:small subunit ribosomal protein S7
MRRACSEKKKIYPDIKYADVNVQKLINNFMIDGKKSIAERLVYKGLEQVASNQGADVVTILTKVIENVSPNKKIISRRFGSTTYSVPKDINPEEKASKGIKILVASTRELAAKPSKKKGEKVSKKGTSALIAFVKVFEQAFNNEGPAVGKKDELHRVAKENEAFAHFIIR